MEIRNEIPPIYYSLKDQFNVSWEDIIIAYAPNIYSSKPIPKEKEVHEMVHILRQQEIGVDVWWGMYLEDTDFRLKEELLAYSAEILWLKEKSGYNRQYRRLLMNKIYDAISSSVYGHMITKKQAKEILT